MVYAFEFLMPVNVDFIYYQSGFETLEEAESKLESFAESHCRGEITATAIVSSNDNGYRIINEYMFCRTDGKLKKLVKLAQFF